jgi:hypothetical protein
MSLLNVRNMINFLKNKMKELFEKSIFFKIKYGKCRINDKTYGKKSEFLLKFRKQEA